MLLATLALAEDAHDNDGSLVRTMRGADAANGRVYGTGSPMSVDGDGWGGSDGDWD